MGSRLVVIGLGLALGCGGSDRVTLGLLPEGAAGLGGAPPMGAAGASGDGGRGGQGGSGGRVGEGSPSIDGIDGVGGGRAVALDGGTPGNDAGDGPRADAGAGAGGAPGGAVDAGAGAGSGGVAGAGAAGSSGGGVAGAAGAAGTAGTAGSDGAAGAGDVVVVNLEPSTLGLFAPPIDSSRYAVAGYDAEAGVCVSIIWDYSNNGLELARHCDDFDEYVGFPYVLVEVGPAAGCVSSWGYVGLQPSAASGCIDPVEGLVNVRLEVESEGVRYAVRAVNEPALVGP